ncbi:MAG TPA: CopD family protein [Noviherbaspirillum sp.]|nr:CopD family protein [Noviherbaspirillum sp.]
MIYAKFLHILGFTVWIGGMFFAYMALRPIAATQLEPPQRLALWEGVFGKFFPWVWLAIALIFTGGLFRMAQMGMPPLYVIAMFLLGTVMTVIFAIIFFAPYARLQQAVAAQDWKSGGTALGQIRKLIGTNLILGLVTLAVGALGPVTA